MPSQGALSWAPRRRPPRPAGEGTNTGPGPLEFLLAVGYEIPAEMPAGAYTAHIELTMHNGVKRTADNPFTVEPLG